MRVETVFNEVTEVYTNQLWDFNSEISDSKVYGELKSVSFKKFLPKKDTYYFQKKKTFFTDLSKNKLFVYSEQL